MTRFSCPSCKTVLQTTPEQAGAAISCPTCKAQMRVPVAQNAIPVAPTAPPPVPTAGHGVLETLGNKAEAMGKIAEAGEKVFSFVVNTLISSGLLGTIGSFFKPLASFNFIFFIITFILSGLFVTLWKKNVKLLGRSLAAVCVILVCATVVFGGWSCLDYFGGGKRGYLAENFKVVERLQSSVITKVDGAELGKEVRKQQEAEKRTATSVSEVLDGYPASVVRAEVVGKPRRKKGTGDRVTVEYDLQVSIDMDKYDAVVSKLVPTPGGVPGTPRLSHS